MEALRSHLLIGLAALAAATGACAADTPLAPASRLQVSLAMAEAMSRAALDYARSNKLNLAVVVVDADGRLVTASRMDGVNADIVDVARKKARGALIMQQPTAAMSSWTVESRVAVAGLDDVLLVRGGLPLRHEGKVIGAIGASGASVADDEAAVLHAVGKVMPAQAAAR